MPAASGLAGVAVSQLFGLVGNRQRYRAEHEDRLWQQRVDVYLDVLVYLRRRGTEVWDGPSEDDADLVRLEPVAEPEPLLEARISAFASHAVQELWRSVGFKRGSWNHPGGTNLRYVVDQYDMAVHELERRVVRELESHAYAQPKARRFQP